MGKNFGIGFATGDKLLEIKIKTLISKPGVPSFVAGLFVWSAVWSLKPGKSYFLG